MKTVFKNLRIGERFTFEETEGAQIFEKRDYNLYAPANNTKDIRRTISSVNQIIYITNRKG